MNLFIENAIVEGNKSDIVVKNNQIKALGSDIDAKQIKPTNKIDAEGKIAIPGFYNGHGHAAMTLFRGYGDDLPLKKWLQEKIWPLEENLTREQVYWGTRMACAEMARTGTVFFNDMYWEYEGIVEAVKDSGLRAMISGVFIDQFDSNTAELQQKKNIERFQRSEQLPDRIQFALGPHSIYTVSEDSLRWIADFSREHEVPVHIHLAETKEEMEKSRDRYGTTPVRFLEKINFLHDRVLVAHAIWIDQEELDILADNGVSVVYNPLSNLKLCSGMEFQYTDMKKRGIPVCLGTDGVASNNNLNLLEEIKCSALLQKSLNDDATVLSAQEVLSLATKDAADIFGLSGGRVEEGALADFLLIDKSHPSLTPKHNLDSQIAYSLNPEAIETVVCNGSVIMDQGKIVDYEKILEGFQESIDQLFH